MGVVELPTDGDGSKFAVCSTCSASGYLEKKPVCDESKLDKYSQNRVVSHYKPSGCPRDILKMTLQAQSQKVNSTTLLRHEFIRQGRFKTG